MNNNNNKNRNKLKPWAINYLFHHFLETQAKP